MGANEHQKPAGPGEGSMPAVSRAPVWLKGLPTARFFKYLFLLIALALTLRVVFDGYSYYIARRDIDSELQSKKGYSFEYLDVLSRRKRALAAVTLETRCLERVELTLFRIFEGELEAKMNGAYKEFVEQKNTIIDIIKQLGADVIDVDAASKYVDGATFTPLEFHLHLRRLPDVKKDDEKYTRLLSEAYSKIEEYIKISAKYSALRAQAVEAIRQDTVKGAFIDVVRSFGPKVIDADAAIKYVTGVTFSPSGLDPYLTPVAGVTKDDKNYQQLMEKVEAVRKWSQLTHDLPAKYLSLDAIKLLEDRLARLRDEEKRIKDIGGDIEDVMARYAIWTRALAGNAAYSPILDEMAYTIRKEDENLLRSVRCDRLKEYYQAVDQQLIQADPRWWELPKHLNLRYSYLLQRYFQQPPTAQTLFVTLFLGALGALTLNVLRLSKIGWWARETDPMWGEIIVGPLLGALAAFAIYLVGSAGLLLSTDVRASQGGATPLSAFFIGLLGFLSGLLYDEAFGRVRRVGQNLFAGKGAEAADSARAEDRALADTLKGVGASLSAGLVIKHGLGTRLAMEEQFTLLIPSDEAVGKLSLSTWTNLNDKDKPDFKKWYDRHHSPQRVTKKDVIDAAVNAAVHELKVDDGTVYALAIDGNDLKVNDIRIMIADTSWNKGTIHVLSEDLP